MLYDTIHDFYNKDGSTNTLLNNLKFHTYIFKYRYKSINLYKAKIV